MRLLQSFCLLLLCLTTSLQGGKANSPLLIISLDAFRWDYCDLYPEQTPTLRRLRSEGASAKGLVPVFPSNTFPNHYTIVTGLRPAGHGVINNVMYDPGLGQYFRNWIPALVGDSRWWGGEPIWVTAELAGKRAACSFWVGSEAEIKGVRPTWWRRFDYSVPYERRLEEMLGWLQLEPERRPQVIAFYFEETNAEGHREGPGSRAVQQAIQKLDSQLASMLRGIRQLGMEPNLVIVSDHGMTEVRPDHCVALEDVMDLTGVQVDFTGPVAGLRPLQGTAEELVAKLGALPAGARAYTAETLPPEFKLGSHPRVPPVLVLAAQGGWVDLRAGLKTRLATTKGEHGYDPSHTDMHGVLIVHGPAFRSDGRVMEPVENVHLYHLFCAVLQLNPAPNDGDERLVRTLLKP